MIVGVPKEIKVDEYRVGMTPATVRELVVLGHEVLVERGAGKGSSFTDGEYAGAGAKMADGPETIFSQAELVVKVKEPLAGERALLRRGQVLFTFLHLAPDKEMTEDLVASEAICIGYETVETTDGNLPLLAPMSEIAGRMATQIGAELLQRPKGGRGVLMGGVPGVSPAAVVVLGGGVVGVNAARVAMGLGAEVVVVDIDIPRLRTIDDLHSGRIRTLYSNQHNIETAIAEADLVVGAVLVHGARAPILVRRELLSTMNQGAVVVDVAVDQGGCIETTRPTTHTEPTYVVDGIVHYGVSNMPGAVPNTATAALSHATSSYVIRLAELGWRRACAEDPALGHGVNVACGAVTSEPVALSHGMRYVPLAEVC